MKQLKQYEKTYKCDLILSAEGNATGYVYLTEDEYNIVKKVANTSNWQDFEDEGWSGTFGIYCEELEERRDKF